MDIWKLNFVRWFCISINLWVRVMVFNTIFNSISVISCINYGFIVRKDSSTSTKRCFPQWQLITLCFVSCYTNIGVTAPCFTATNLHCIFITSYANLFFFGFMYDRVISIHVSFSIYIHCTYKGRSLIHDINIRD